MKAEDILKEAKAKLREKYPLKDSASYFVALEAINIAYEKGKKNAPLPSSIQEALNSGDGVYRP